MKLSEEAIAAYERVAQAAAIVENARLSKLKGELARTLGVRQSAVEVDEDSRCLVVDGLYFRVDKVTREVFVRCVNNEFIDIYGIASLGKLIQEGLVNAE